MAKIQAVWAIDIGQAALKALKLVPSAEADQVIAEAFDFVEYPKILSQPDADPEELVREALETFLGRNDIKGTRVAVSVPGQQGLVKFIKLPPVEKKRIPDIVKFEAKQQIPFALEEVIWDYQQIGDDEEEGGDDDFTMAEVGLFAMKRDQIFRAIQPFKTAGIEVDVVQMSPIALYNFAAYEKMASATADGGSVVLLDIGADNTDLIITDGVRIWQRNVPIGGNHFTRALTKELKLTFAKAEHLKRNATKSQDPKAVFTAMRGVFNDFSSEVGRSIGFYSSVNRSAKIQKIIGLGNGFKLPGLQKFLQQNLNYDVERLEGFTHLAGEEVATAPQFLENLMSFAVVYGLGVQGLEAGKLRTNLLPPEIEQVRMIRRKKPWALAASILLMLGFTSMFVGDWNALAKVENEAMKSAVSRAKSVAQQGASAKSAYDSAVGTFNAKKAEGEALVPATPEEASWPALLTTLNRILPDPVKEYDLDPNLPTNHEIIRDLRIHIDGIVPRFRTEVGEWLTEANGPQDWAKEYMHPYDRANAPAGEGWIIQVIGHHYNPSPVGAAAKKLTDREKPFAMGPLPYLTQYRPSAPNVPAIVGLLPRMWAPALRQFGIHHATITWVSPDAKWVTSKASGAAALPPLLTKASPPASAAGGGESSMANMYAGMAGMANRMGGMGGSSGGMMMEGGMMDPSMMAGMYGRGMGMGMGMGGDASKKIEETTLTRTDFMLQFVWQPPAADAEKKSLQDIAEELTKAAQGQGAPKLPSEEQIAEASRKQSEQAVEAQIKAMGGGAAPGGAAPAPGAPAPAPAAGTPVPGAPAIPK